MEKQNLYTIQERLHEIKTAINLLEDTFSNLEHALAIDNKEFTQESRDLIAYAIYRDFETYQFLTNLVSNYTQQARTLLDTTIEEVVKDDTTNPFDVSHTEAWESDLEG